MTRSTTGSTKLLLVAVAAAVAAFCAAPAATASPAATLKATNTCWLQVVNDWLKNGQVEGTYANACYAQAIQHLQGYPDISQYSSAIDDIHRAQLAALNHHGGPPSGPGNSSGGPTAGGGGGNGGGGGGTTGGTAGTSKGLFHKLAQKLGPSNAQSIPLPLLVLSGLALLLLLTAGATWLARRYQSRHVTPAPAVAKRR